MKALLVILLIGLFALVAFRFSWGAERQAELASPSIPRPGMAQVIMDYSPREIPMDKPLPKLALHFYRDSMSGVNLHIDIEDFQMGPPEMEVGEGVIGGHAHLYVNGKKVQRIYGRYLHLPDELFNPGINLVMVSLNTHDHRVWQRGKKQILASSFVSLEREELVLYSFSSSPISG